MRASKECAAARIASAVASMMRLLSPTTIPVFNIFIHVMGNEIYDGAQTYCSVSHHRLLSNASFIVTFFDVFFFSSHVHTYVCIHIPVIAHPGFVTPYSHNGNHPSLSLHATNARPLTSTAAAAEGNHSHLFHSLPSSRLWVAVTVPVTRNLNTHQPATSQSNVVAPPQPHDGIHINRLLIPTYSSIPPLTQHTQALTTNRHISLPLTHCIPNVHPTPLVIEPRPR